MGTLCFIIHPYELLGQAEGDDEAGPSQEGADHDVGDVMLFDEERRGGDQEGDGGNGNAPTRSAQPQKEQRDENDIGQMQAGKTAES